MSLRIGRLIARSFLAVMMLTVALHSNPVRSQSLAEVDPFQLDIRDILALQSALASQNLYAGSIDGQWGALSQSALDRWLQRHRRGHFSTESAHSMAENYWRFLEAGNWGTYWVTQADISFHFPWAILTNRVESDVFFLGWESPNGGLVVLVHFDDARGTLALHDYFLAETPARTAPYLSINDGLAVTSIDRRDGGRTYLRSDWTGEFYGSVIVMASSSLLSEANFLITSIAQGFGPRLDIPVRDFPFLDLTYEQVASPVQPEPNAPYPQPPDQVATAVAPAPSEVVGTGTGFFVNPSDIVTAYHVIRECALVTLSDGTVLSLIAEDQSVDLAVLSASRRSPHWLTLSPEAGARLGQTAHALGYPYSNILNTGLSLTSGNVSAVRDISGSESGFLFSAPVQPGNSGGPVLSSSGTVIGVVVSRLDDLAVLETTGTLPQNMNFAASTLAIYDFLEDSLVILPAGEAAPFDLEDGLSSEMASAIVEIECRN